MKPVDLFVAADHHAPIPLPSSGADRRSIRERAGVSQEHLAVVVGCSVPALLRWERDGIEPRRATHRERYSRLLAAMVDYSTRLAALSAAASGR